MLVGFISFFDRGSTSQLVAGSLWQLGFLVAVTHARPFTSSFADTLKSAVDCAILVTLTLSMALKLDLSDELGS